MQGSDATQIIVLEACQDITDLYIPNTVLCIGGYVNPLSFYRNFVSKNLPVKIAAAVSHWGAIDKWTDEYLEETIGDNEVTVSITPNGLADAVVDNKFLLPYENKIKLRDVLCELQNPDPSRVLYLQRQNSSLTEEFSSLMGDIDGELEWASAAFGTSIDAINFWLGDGRAISSLHKDPYENVYCVIRGSKTFTLYPPTDRPLLQYKMYDVWRYTENGGIQPEPDCPRTPWIDIDPRDPLTSNIPGTHPLVVTVRAGETLYLPSYWFHHVRQEHGTIAVNYWYDIDYGPAFGLFNLLDKLSVAREKDEDSDDDNDED